MLGARIQMQSAAIRQSAAIGQGAASGKAPRQAKRRVRQGAASGKAPRQARRNERLTLGAAIGGRRRGGVLDDWASLGD